MTDAAGALLDRSTPSRRRPWRVLAVVLVLGGTVVWLMSARAVAITEGVSTSAEFVSGERLHVGQPGMVEGDIEVLWARPRIIGPGRVELRVCRRGDNAGGGAVGALTGEADIEALCPVLEPFVRGTRLAAERPGGSSYDYVLMSLVPTSADEPVFYCGVDVLYRSGARFGFARGAGTSDAVVYPPGEEPLVDEAGEPASLSMAGAQDPC